MTQLCERLLMFVAVIMLLVFAVNMIAVRNQLQISAHTLEHSREQMDLLREHQQEQKALREQQRTEESMRRHHTQIECLARNMYFEARGEDPQGQDAVAFVTINRVYSDRYPDTICDVVYQAKTDSQGRLLRHQCQFSWYCDGKPDTVSESVYTQLLRRAEYIYINYYLNNLMADITDGSTHYHAHWVSPHWSQHVNYQLVANIGQHSFYRPTY